tara:strand:+ start:528 stop:917 length:390 start_codon:yes stop_codon:yes gene_type:complete
MVDRYVKTSFFGIHKVVPGTDFIWMASYLGEIGYSVHSSTMEGTKFFFSKGMGDNIIFSLDVFKMDEPHEYMCSVEVNGEDYRTFNGDGDFRQSASAWFYDNEWPVYLDGEPDPNYEWMDDVEAKRVDG